MTTLGRGNIKLPRHRQQAPIFVTSPTPTPPTARTIVAEADTSIARPAESVESSGGRRSTPAQGLSGILKLQDADDSLVLFSSLYLDQRHDDEADEHADWPSRAVRLGSSRSRRARRAMSRARAAVSRHGAAVAGSTAVLARRTRTSSRTTSRATFYRFP